MNKYGIHEHMNEGCRIALFRGDMYNVFIGEPPPKPNRIVHTLDNRGTQVHACSTGILEWSLVSGLDVFVLMGREKPHPIDAWWIEFVAENQVIYAPRKLCHAVPKSERLLHLWRALIFKLRRKRLGCIRSTRDAKQLLACELDFLFGHQIIGRRLSRQSLT